MGRTKEAQYRHAQREAVERDDREALEQALTHTAPVDELLHDAVSRWSPACARLLLEAGADAGHVGIAWECAAQAAASWAVATRDPREWRSLMYASPRPGGWAEGPAIMEAIASRWPETLFVPGKVVPRTKARPHRSTGCAAVRLLEDPGFTALIETAVRACPDALARYEEKARRGRFPSLLDEALLAGNARVVGAVARQLPAGLREVAAPVRLGAPILEEAISRADAAAVEALCKAGALYVGWASRSSERNTPLMRAVLCAEELEPHEWGAFVRMVKSLLEAGEDPYRVDECIGQSAADYVCAWGDQGRPPRELAQCVHGLFLEAALSRRAPGRARGALESGEESVRVL